MLIVIQLFLKSPKTNIIFVKLNNSLCLNKTKLFKT